MDNKRDTKEPFIPFLNTLQSGDMKLSKMIDSAIVLFGHTRAGKTTAAHWLMGSKLQGNGRFWEVKESRYKQAIVSDSSRSVTWIPNIFLSQNLHPQENIPFAVVDEPGFGDSDGFLKIFSNDYFHYKTFTVMKSVYLLLVMDEDRLKKMQPCFDTIEEFFKLFEPTVQMTEIVVGATVLLVTKVEKEMTVDRIYTQIQKLIKSKSESQTATDKTNIEAKDRHLYLLKNIVEQRKIVLMRKPKDNQFLEDGIKKMEEIKSLVKNKAFQRSFMQIGERKEKVLDMKGLRFGVIDYIKKKVSVSTQNLKETNEPTAKEVIQYCQWMEERQVMFLKNGRNSFKSIFTSLLTFNNNEFFKFMRDFNNETIKTLELDKERNPERMRYHYSRVKSFSQALQKTGFKKDKSMKATIRGREREKGRILLAKQLKVRQRILNALLEANLKERLPMNIERFEQFFYLFFIEMKQLVSNQEEEHILAMYHYLLMREIKEGYIFSNLLKLNNKELIRTIQQALEPFKASNKQNANKKSTKFPMVSTHLNDCFDQLLNSMEEYFNKLFQHIQDQLNRFLSISYGRGQNEQHRQMAEPEVIEDYIQCLKQIEESQNIQSSRKAFLLHCKLTQSQVRMRLSDNKYYPELKDLLIDCLTLVQTLTKRNQQLKIQNQTSFYLINLCGHMLSNFFSLYKPACYFFSSANNVHATLQTYEKRIKSNKEEKMVVLQNASNYAYENCRRELAVAYLQEMYDLATNDDKLKEIRQRILQVQTNEYDCNKYLLRLKNNKMQMLTPDLIKETKHFVIKQAEEIAKANQSNISIQA